jgi:hypothetical protein
MGNRSDVTFAFYPRDEVKGWLERHWPQEWCDLEETEDMVLVTYRDVKWYADYVFVGQALAAAQAFERAFEADEDTARAHWEMARIGEDDADVERDGSPFHDYRLGIRREIVW